MLSTIGSLWWLWLLISVVGSSLYHLLIWIATETTDSPKSPITLMVVVALASWVASNAVGLLFWFSLIVQLTKWLQALL